jgi:hypothetical protein
MWESSLTTSSPPYNQLIAKCRWFCLYDISTLSICTATPSFLVNGWSQGNWALSLTPTIASKLLQVPIHFCFPVNLFFHIKVRELFYEHKSRLSIFEIFQWLPIVHGVKCKLFMRALLRRNLCGVWAPLTPGITSCSSLPLESGQCLLPCPWLYWAFPYSGCSFALESSPLALHCSAIFMF